METNGFFYAAFGQSWRTAQSHVIPVDDATTGAAIQSTVVTLFMNQP
jgi:hypothetical protein